MAALGLADGSWASWVRRLGPAGEPPPTDPALGQLLLQRDDDLVVADARQDPRLASSPLVQEPAGTRAFGAFVVRQADGRPCATLCVMDRRRRPLRPAEAAHLRALAAMLGTRLGGAVDLGQMERLLHRHADSGLLVLAREAPHGVIATSAALALALDGDEPAARLLRQRLEGARPPASASCERLPLPRPGASRCAEIEILWAPTAAAADGRGPYWLGLVRPPDGDPAARDVIDLRIDTLLAWLRGLPPPRGQRLLGLVGLVQRHPASPEAQQVVSWCLDRMALRLQAHLREAAWTTAPAGLLAWALDLAPDGDAGPRLEALQAQLSRPMHLDGATLQIAVRMGVHRLAPQGPDRDDLHAAFGALRQAMTDTTGPRVQRPLPDGTTPPRPDRPRILPGTRAGERLELAFDLYCSVRTGQVAKLQLLPCADGEVVAITQADGDSVRLMQAFFTAIERWAGRHRGAIAGRDLLVELPAGALAHPAAVAVLRQFATRQPALACALDLTIPDLSELPVAGRTVVQDLRTLGYRLWWDRFGAAPFALSDLLEFGVVGVRLTGDWVGAANPLEPNRRLVLAAARVAHGLGLKTLADGVRSTGQWAFLRSIKCDAARGPLRGGLLREAELVAALEAADPMVGI